MILVTGGCGFIGTRFVADPRYRFVHGDVCDARLVAGLLAEYRPRAIVHLAAETNVDRAIADATPFGRSNALGTLVLLQAAQAHLARLEQGRLGETYNVAGHQRLTNRELVERLIDAVDVERAAHGRAPAPAGKVASDDTGTGSAASQHRPPAAPARIRFVADRPGHDRRYALDDRKLREETGWSAQVGLDQGLRATVRARLASIDLGIENPP